MTATRFIAGPVSASVTRMTAALDLDVPHLVHGKLLLADSRGDVLRVPHLALPDAHLFRDDGLLRHRDALLSHGDDDLFLADVALGRSAGSGTPLDDDLLPLDRDVDGLLLADDALADADLAGLDRRLIDLEALLSQLDGPVIS